MGSTFAIELPIYSRSMDHQATTATDMNSNVTIPTRLQPRSHMGPVTVVRIAPYESVPDVVVDYNDSFIEGAAETLSILIVDDSSANRSAPLYASICT